MSINNQVLTQQRIHSCAMYFRSSVMVIAVCTLCLTWMHQEAYADYLYIKKSTVQITKNIFSFDGTVTWRVDAGKLKPTVSGKLKGVNGRGLCARMRLEFYGGGHVPLTTKYGGQVCPKSNQLQQYSVSLDPYGSNKLNEVKVSIEKKTASKDWFSIASRTVKLGLINEKVKITENGFDFGGQAFDNGAPKKSGNVAWSWSEGKLSPRVTGTLHITNAAGACARLQIEYFGLAFDDLLATKTGGKVCASDNQRWYRKVDLSKYSDSRTAKIVIHLQTLRADGTWRAIGEADSAYISDTLYNHTSHLSGGVGS